MKRLTKEGWRTLGIYNTYDMCKRGGRGVYVAYRPAQHGLLAQYAQWVVVRPGYQTDPAHGHELDGRNKTFTVYTRRHKEPERLSAIEWATKRYGFTGEWERDPWGGWHPAGTLEAAQKVCESAAASTQKETK